MSVPVSPNTSHRRLIVLVEHQSNGSLICMRVSSIVNAPAALAAMSTDVDASKKYYECHGKPIYTALRAE